MYWNPEAFPILFSVWISAKVEMWHWPLIQATFLSHPWNLVCFLSRLSDDTKKELATLKENLSKTVSHMNDLKIDFDAKNNTIQVRLVLT